jgi:hypothetical protein
MKQRRNKNPKVKENLRARERKQQEDALDDALKHTFPASDPVSAEQPTRPALDIRLGLSIRALRHSRI